MAEPKRTPNGCTRIYVLRDPRNGLPMYVGKSNAPYVSSRLAQHMHVRDDDTSPRAEWVRELKAIGMRPELGVLETVKTEAEVRAEQYWIEMFEPLSPRLLNRYNPDLSLTRPVDSCRKIANFRRQFKGWKHSEETKAKIGRSGAENGNFGKSASPETRALLSESLKGNENAKGYKHSAETKAKVSAAGTGREKSLETRRKLSEANKGKVFAPETLAKMSAAKKGVPLSAAHRAKSIAVLAAVVRKPFSAETKAKIAAKARARGPLSEEHKASIAAAHRRRYASDSK